MEPKKILLAVAPVSHNLALIPGNPTSPRQVADQTISCARAGASMVHLHVRDENGEQTAKLQHYSETLDMIRNDSDIVIQGSTGGLTSLSLEERCVSLYEPRTEVASLNLGSTNFKSTVYINTLEDIRYWAARMKEALVVPELELFSIGMFNSVERLVEEDLLPPDPKNHHYNFALGFEGALPADIETLTVLKSRLPAGVGFGVLNEGFQGFGFLAGALALGASSVRVGFEDGAWLSPGVPAENNAQLVERAVQLIHLLGMEVMSPAEARQHLGVVRRS